jgi:pSer/pThr/pTyr-binding forkhead associated (FHA) protein
MADVTLRVLDGADRGRVYDHLATPVTIGREEGNSVQLNDERISRFHIKIQEDQGKLVLTDLESTNGTRVNGEDVQLRILQFGDVIAVGRSILLYGTKDQIVGRLDALRENGLSVTDDLSPEKVSSEFGPESMDFELRWGPQRRSCRRG